MSQFMPLGDRDEKLANCVRCTVCKWSPVIKDDRFATICPSFHYGKNFAYTGGGRLITGYAQVHERVPEDGTLTDLIYACSMCGGCDVACKTNTGELVEPLESLYAIRANAVERDLHPQALRTVLENLRTSGNVHGATPLAREEWIAAAGLEALLGRRANVLVHVGDAAFYPAVWPGLGAAVDRMIRAGLDVSLGGEQEPDCGGLAFEIGDQALALALAERTCAWIAASGARTVITFSDGAFAAMRAIWPRLGVMLPDVTLLHVSEWLADAGGTEPVAADVVTYHDSCQLGRLSDPYSGPEGTLSYVFNSMAVYEPERPLRTGAGGVFDAPRTVLRNAGATVVEMKRTREFAFCCGAGGGGLAANPDFAHSAALHRLDEAAATGADVLVTSCHGCAAHMAAVAAAAQRPVRVVSLIEYLAHGRSATDAAAIEEVSQ